MVHGEGIEPPEPLPWLQRKLWFRGESALPSAESQGVGLPEELADLRGILHLPIAPGLTKTRLNLRRFRRRTLAEIYGPVTTRLRQDVTSIVVDLR
jgi:hypothetical protein